MNKDQYLPSLTGIRAVAAYMVFIFHYNPFTNGSFLHGFFNEFYIGVTFFFVLSGFLITFKYYDVKGSALKAYLVKRFARIYPLYFMLTTLTYLFYFFTKGQFDLNIYLLNITFLKGFFNEIKFSGIAQGWTLTVEEMFYILAPLIFVFLKQRRINFIFLPFLFTFVGVVLTYAFGGGAWGFFEDLEFTFIYTFFGRSFEFFIGAALAVFVRNNKIRGAFKYKTICSIVLIILFVVTLSFTKGDMHFGVSSPIGIFINNVLLPLAIAMFYWGLIIEQTWIKSLLGTKLFLQLGKSSYAFYLIHVGFISTLFVSGLGSSVLLFPILVVFSYLIYKFIEEPINLGLRRMFSK